MTTTTMTTTTPTTASLRTASPARPLQARLRTLVRGREADPAWVRPAVLALLAGTGVLHLAGLSASGWANAYYSAAAQAGSQSWAAFFYGSLDGGNSITVDKPPASLWVLSLSVRLFGLSPWSLLVPQALMGVATVAVLYLAVRRVAGPGPGLVAGAAMAVTPVAVLMFRFNNPDALLVLLLTLAAYAFGRAVETASRQWLALVGVLVGFAFLTKMLQALLVVPAFALVYLVAAPTTLRSRLLHLLGAGLALLVSAGWWVAIVELVPEGSRPYIGGSQTNSVWELIWGYNGLGRLTGEEIGSVGPAPGLDSSGLGRLFGAAVGGQVAWLLPAALALLVAGLVATGRAPRTDVRRAALLSWGGWLIVTGLVFSLMAGIFHEYYTVALAPAISALVGIGGGLLWKRRDELWARALLAVTLAGTAAWAWVLLSRTPGFLPGLRWAVLIAGLVAALGMFALPRAGRVLAATVLAVGLVAGGAGPVAYALQTASTAHTGAIPLAGPATGAGIGFVGGPAGRPADPYGYLPGAGGVPRGPDGAGPAAAPRGGTGGGTVTIGPGGSGGPGGPGGAGEAVGGLLDAGRVSDVMADALTGDTSSYTWVAATVGANNAAGYQLATGSPVMAIGGFNGTDPSPTLEQFQRYVAEGRIHWFIGSDMGFPSNGGSDAASRIAAWVTENFAARTVDGVTLYDLTRPLD